MPIGGPPQTVCVEEHSGQPTVGYERNCDHRIFVSVSNARAVSAGSRMTAAAQLADQLQEAFLLQLLAEVTPHSVMKMPEPCSLYWKRSSGSDLCSILALNPVLFATRLFVLVHFILIQSNVERYAIINSLNCFFNKIYIN